MSQSSEHCRSKEASRILARMTQADVNGLSERVEKLQLDVIEIYSTEGKFVRVKLLDMLKRLLLSEGEDRHDVVLFGEGNFTFSIALASCCQSWDRITSTRYEPISCDHPEPYFSDVKVEASQYCIENGERLGGMDHTVLSRVKLVLNLPRPPVGTWQFGVDATNTPETLNVKGKIVWFQCPWSKEDVHVHALVAKFLNHMAEKQSAKDYALIGLANMPRYVKEYRIQDLLSENLAEDRSQQYKFLGADKKMIEEILKYGYHHEGYRDIHDYILTCHITLVFRRK